MDYQEIVDAGLAYADRFNDPEVNNNIDTFLRFGEARLSRLLKVRKASVRAILPLNTEDEYYSLPSDYAGMRDIQIDNPEGNGRTRTLYYANPEQMNLHSQTPTNETATGERVNDIGYYTIIADQIQIWPKGGGGDILEIVYYRRIPPLTSDNPNNWVSDDHPDIYLSLLMFEITIFTKDYDASAGWETRLDKALDELEVSDVVERWAGTPMSTKTDSQARYPEARAG